MIVDSYFLGLDSESQPATPEWKTPNQVASAADSKFSAQRPETNSLARAARVAARLELKFGELDSQLEQAWSV